MFPQNKVELQEAQMTIQRLESQVSHHSKSTDRKEKDFELAIRARDEALREVQKLQLQVDTLEARDRQKVWITGGRGRQKVGITKARDRQKVWITGGRVRQKVGIT